MTCYESNVNCIKKNNDILYQSICIYDVHETCNGIIVKSVDTRDGNKALLVEKEDQSYRLNSVYNPIAEAKKWIDQYEFLDLNIVVAMFGLGNGIFLREIINKIGRQDRIIIYEPSLDIFLHIINNYDLQDIFSNKHISIVIDGVNNQELIAFLNKNVNWTNMNSQMQFVHPQYDKIFHKNYIEFLEVINNHNTVQAANKNTAAFLGEAVARNTIHNIRYITNSNITSDLYDELPENVPAIIVGAGPSLDNNIVELKRAKGKSIIFATDTSLKYLLAHDIIPDFIVTLDALKSNRHFEDDRWKDIPLLCSIESKSAILDLHRGKKIFFNTGKYLEHMYLTLGKTLLTYSSGGSVATACFSICANLGFKKIVLIGQDLAYKGDFTHAGDVILNARGSGQNTLMVKNIYGNMIKTRYDWYTYILWYNEAISICKEHSIEVIDATEGGAKLEGSTVMTLSEVIREYCNISVDCKETYENIKPTFNDKEIALFKDNLTKSIDELKAIEINAIRAYEICSKLIVAAKKNQLENYKNQSLVKEITKINNFIQNKGVYYLIDDFILGSTTSQLGEIIHGTNDIQINQLNTYNRAKIIYTLMKDAAKELGPLFEEVLSNF